ncbi:hypothetical protein BKA93DRAFT_262260 [Sparassis latifolia]
MWRIQPRRYWARSDRSELPVKVESRLVSSSISCGDHFDSRTRELPICLCAQSYIIPTQVFRGKNAPPANCHLERLQFIHPPNVSSLVIQSLFPTRLVPFHHGGHAHATSILHLSTTVRFRSNWPWYIGFINYLLHYVEELRTPEFSLLCHGAYKTMRPSDAGSLSPITHC